MKTDTRPEECSTINRFHQIFYIWLSLYKYYTLFISKNGINFSPIRTSSINKINVREDFRKNSSPCQQCVTCGRFGIIFLTIVILLFKSSSNNQSKQYICINESFCKENLGTINKYGKKIPNNVVIVQSFHQVDIQWF